LGLIIGKGGGTVKRLVYDSGARIIVVGRCSLTV
jgi:hypothetical protein